MAVIAAAIADPIVEFASNAGWFGPGNFTDHSNLDIFPALVSGVSLLALYMFRKARAVLAGRALPQRIRALLPTVFLLQMLTLYLMESIEQIVAWGHPLGAMVWLGAPLPISLAMHAVICLAVTYAIARSGRVLAVTTIRVIRLVGAIANLTREAAAPIALRWFEHTAFKALLPLPCTIGERAPPPALS